MLADLITMITSDCVDHMRIDKDKFGCLMVLKVLPILTDVNFWGQSGLTKMLWDFQVFTPGSRL